MGTHLGEMKDAISNLQYAYKGQRELSPMGSRTNSIRLVVLADDTLNISHQLGSYLIGVI